MNNEFKQQLQEREFSVLKNAHRVLLKWATGCGKSKMAIDLVNNQVATTFALLKPVKVLFLVAERAHIGNWQDELYKWHYRKDRIASTVICYKSLHKVKDNCYDIIVMDECHHACAPKTYSYLEEMGAINANSVVYLLSATLSSNKQEMIEDIFGSFTVSTVTLNDAIEKDILPDPKVYVIGMDLDNTIANQEIRIGNASNPPVIRWEDRAKYVYGNKPCIIRCTESQKNSFLTSKINYWNERYHHSHQEFHRIQAANTGSQRKRFLGELKTDVVRKLIGMLPDRMRYVCFCASVPQATSLSKTNTIAAKKGDKHNQAIINAFNNGDIDSIYAVGMINEGMNLTDIQAGIIVQLDGKERLFVQKFGRVCRADSPVCYIFYYKGTQDEVYLKQALENLDPKFIKYCNVNEL